MKKAKNAVFDDICLKKYSILMIIGKNCNEHRGVFD
jgi:hypothetical protein